MTATNLGGGGANKFLGSYVKNVSNSLGLSTSPSTVSVTVVEDDDALFEFPSVGSFQSLSLGSAWKFAGVLTKYEIDVANISGKTIRVSLSDPREIMKSIPVILAPGSEAIVDTVNSTGCSILDIYGAYGEGLINLSGWNQSGMPFERIVSALKGDNILFGTAVIPVPQQIVSVFGERYVFDLTEVAAIVNPNHRINTNLAPLSNLIEDLSQRHAFDWFVESEQAADGIITVTIRVIDRSVDNIDIDLQSFLDLHLDKVITATSGVELRNEVACMALQGGMVESLTKVAILGVANEPIDLTLESGVNNYIMTEPEMAAVLVGQPQWQTYLGNSSEESPGQGLARYGPHWRDDDIASPTRLVVDVAKQDGNDKNKINAFPPGRGAFLAITALSKRASIGRLYTKLVAHAKASYGKRFVHDSILDEIIQSAWTRGVVAGNEDPNEYFRQDDGRTKAYVEFSLEDAGGAFSLGLADLTSLFGNQDLFRNVTVFGNTFNNRTLAENAILVLELATNFNPNNVSIEINDVSAYVHKESSSPFANVKTSLYVSCTVNKDGVVSIPGIVTQKQPPQNQLLNDAIRIAGEQEPPISTTAALRKYHNKLKRFYGNAYFSKHALAYQPKYVYIPTRSRTLRYGPVFSSNLGADAQGKVQIIQDDGFTPWEFGSISAMLASMQVKVDNATSLQKEAFTANIQVEGFPQFNIGDSLEKNSNINSISMSFGDGGVKTTYSLQTYTRKFGEISKEELALIAFMVNNGGGRVLPQQQAGFLSGHNVNVDKGFGSHLGVNSSNLNGGSLDFG